MVRAMQPQKPLANQFLGLLLHLVQRLHQQLCHGPTFPTRKHILIGRCGMRQLQVTVCGLALLPLLLLLLLATLLKLLRLH